jgi:hypothetical protein
MDEAMGEVDLVPGQGAQLRYAQAMPVSHEDHGGVAQAIAPPTLLGGSEQTIHLLGYEVLAWPDILVEAPRWRNCPILKSWAPSLSR